MREEFEKLPEIAKRLEMNCVYFNGTWYATNPHMGASFATAQYLNGAWYAFQEQQKIIDMQECGATEIQMILGDGEYDDLTKLERIKELLK